MTHDAHDRLPADLEDVARRLADSRADASELELDQIKLRAQAAAAAPRPRGTHVRARLIAGLVALGLLVGGTGSVIAGSGGGGSSGNSSANSQYCPPSSPGAGKPKHQGGGNKCGHP